MGRAQLRRQRRVLRLAEPADLGQAKDQLAGRSADIRGAHQGGPHQEAVHQRGQRLDLAPVTDARFRDYQWARGDQGSQPPGGRQVHGQGAQVPVVHPDDAGSQPDRAVQLGFSMHLGQGAHPEPGGRVGAGLIGGVVQHREHQQHGVGAVVPSFHHLVGVQHEVLAQHRLGDRRPHLGQQLERAAEEGAVSEH